MPIPSTIFFSFITTGWSVSFVDIGVSIQPYLSRNAAKAFCSSDSFDIRSDTAPTAAPLTILPFDNASKPAGIVTAPVATAALAAATVPSARVPKCTKPRSCLPHHVFVSIGLSYAPNGLQSRLYDPVSHLSLCISPDNASIVRSGKVAIEDAVS